jgi:hypothetical protein
MNSSGRVRCDSGGGVRLCRPVGLREGANQLDPRNSAQDRDGGTDGKCPPEMSRAVHDEPGDRANDNTGDIAQTVLHANDHHSRRNCSHCRFRWRLQRTCAEPPREHRSCFVA